MLNRILRLFEAVSVFSLFAMCGLLFIEIVANELGIQVVWIREVVQILNIWLVFLMVPVIERFEHHFRIDYFVERLPKTAEKFMTKFGLALSLGITVVVGYSVYISMVGSVNSSTPILDLPQWVLYLPLFIGSLLFVVVSGQVLLGRVPVDRQ
jgi:TRAP-type C4-dicarboxylate transport system permease small subunit